MYLKEVHNPQRAYSSEVFSFRALEMLRENSCKNIGDS